MVDTVKMINGYKHCAVNHICAGCAYRAEDDATYINELLSDMHAYIEELEAAKIERDALREEVQKMIAERRWIRAEDEKPPYDTEVKVWTTDGRELIAVYTRSAEWVTEYFAEITRKVTHWMPPDEGPKEE